MIGAGTAADAVKEQYGRTVRRHQGRRQVRVERIRDVDLDLDPLDGEVFGSKIERNGGRFARCQNHRGATVSVRHGQVVEYLEGVADLRCKLPHRGEGELVRGSRIRSNDVG